jgi:hypothetical protein
MLLFIQLDIHIYWHAQSFHLLYFESVSVMAHKNGGSIDYLPSFSLIQRFPYSCIALHPPPLFSWIWTLPYGHMRTVSVLLDELFHK